MKKIQRHSNLIINVILGFLTITFAILFYSFFTQLNVLKKSLENNANAQYGGNEVRIISRTINTTKELDNLYITKKSHKTLGDLIDEINKNEQIFDFYRDPTLGRFITSVNQHEALYKNGSYWQILSPTFMQKMSFDSFKKDDDFSFYHKDWAIEVGVDLLPLVNDSIIIFYETLR